MIIYKDNSRLSLELMMFSCDICPRLGILLNMIKNNNVNEAYIIYNSLISQEVRDKLISLSKSFNSKGLAGLNLQIVDYSTETTSYNTWLSYFSSFIFKPKHHKITSTIKDILLLYNILPKEVPSSTEYYYHDVLSKILSYFRDLLTYAIE